MRTSIAVGIGLMMAMQLASVGAAAPSKFSVQGVLRDNAGKLQSLEVGVVVSLFDSAEGGTRLRVYGPTKVVPKNGVFTVAFADAELLTWLKQSQEVWLELIVEGEAFPRQLVTSHFYAFVAQHAVEADHATEADHALAADHAVTADALSTGCAGCITGSQIAPGSIEAGQLAPGALTHGHGLVMRKSQPVTVILAAAGDANGDDIQNVDSEPCLADEVPVSAGCINGSGSVYLLRADVITVVENNVSVRKARCSYRNVSNTTKQVSTSVLCLKVTPAL